MGSALRKTEFQYDKNGRLKKTIDPINAYDSQLPLNHTTSYISYTYDYAGNIRTKSDGNGTTEYIYDEFDRIYEVKNAANNEKTRYLYDYSGNLNTQEVLEIKQGSSVYTSYRKKTFEYNVLNKLTKTVIHWDRDTQNSYTQQKVESYKYYADGSLKEKTDRKGAVTTYIYDVHGRVKSQKTVKTGETSVEIKYGYDNNGNLSNVENISGGTVTDTIVRQYDPLNRVTSKIVTGIGEVTYKYDIISNRVGMEQGLTAETSTDPKSNKTTKVYDTNGRLKYVIDGEANTGVICTTYEYNRNGSLQSLTYHGGTKEEYTYWADGQLKQLINSKPDGTEIDRYKYQYDVAHNQIRKTDKKGNTIYIYDKLNRLETVSEPSGRAIKYDYDAAGNRKAETITKGSVVTTNTYIYNELDWLTGIKVNNALVTSYTYDNNGNMTAIYQNSNLKQIYIYDLLNRMIGVNAPNGSSIMSCKYNGEGLRVSKTSQGTTTKYLYEFDKVVLEVDSANTQARNIYGTNLVNRTVDNTTLYYMYNGHSDVTALINVNSFNVVGTYYYDSFGNILERTGSVNNSITYAGYQYDKETEVRDANGNVIETGLYYLNSRMYDSKIARFLQEDTVKGNPNDPLSLNL